MLKNNRLKYCREGLELTQTELGYIFGVTKYTVSGWENGFDYIPLKKLVKFCNMYNYSIDYVLGLSNDNLAYKKIIINKTIIGKKLKHIRKMYKMTQEKVANKLNISQSCYSQYENGNSLLTTIFLYTFAKYFNVSADYILDREKF